MVFILDLENLETQLQAKNICSIDLSIEKGRIRELSASKSLLLRVVVKYWRASERAAGHRIMSPCQSTNRVELVDKEGKWSSGGRPPLSLSEDLVRPLTSARLTG